MQLQKIKKKSQKHFGVTVTFDGIEIEEVSSIELKTAIKNLVEKANEILTTISLNWQNYDKKMHKEISKEIFWGLSHGFGHDENNAIFRVKVGEKPLQLCINGPFKAFTSQSLISMKRVMMSSRWNK